MLGRSNLKVEMSQKSKIKFGTRNRLFEIIPKIKTTSRCILDDSATIPAQVPYAKHIVESTHIQNQKENKR